MKGSERKIRPRQTLIETAFVSSTRSSTEDLDEVDRIANHPVLRSSEPDSGRVGGMRRSRSEMGGSVDRGVSSFLARYRHTGGEILNRKCEYLVSRGCKLRAGIFL